MHVMRGRRSSALTYPERNCAIEASGIFSDIASAVGRRLIAYVKLTLPLTRSNTHTQTHIHTRTHTQTGVCLHYYNNYMHIILYKCFCTNDVCMTEWVV